MPLHTHLGDYIKKCIKNADKDVEQLELSYIAGGSVKWFSSSEKVWQFLKKSDIQAPYDPAIPFLGIYPREFETHVYVYLYIWTKICI